MTGGYLLGEVSYGWDTQLIGGYLSVGVSYGLDSYR